MEIVLIIISALLWGAAFWSLWKRRLLAPAFSYLALLLLSFARTPEGYSLLPVNNMILTGWLCMTLIVMVATLLQPDSERRDTAGVGYMTVGAVVGMAVGLLGFSVAETPGMRYSIMIVATAAGTFFGYLLFGNTPQGRSGRLEGVRERRGLFASLLSKGFPIALTVMQLGVALVLLIALYARG